jgi:hypothetical protein
MDITTRQRLLYGMAGLFLAAAGGAVYWSLADLGTSPSAPATNSAVARPDRRGPDPRDSIDQAVLTRSLRGPLHDPPPAKPKPPPSRPVARPQPPPPPASPKLTLVGTLIERDQRLAIVSDEDGKFDVKGVGEALELSPAGVRIAGIDPQQVTVEYQGRRSTIALDKSMRAGSPSENRKGGVRRRNR